MRLHQLHIENIGTFLEGTIDFITPEDNPQKPPVVIITGENGTGKTLILDAIREVFGNNYQKDTQSRRDIARVSYIPQIMLNLSYGKTAAYFRTYYDDETEDTFSFKGYEPFWNVDYGFIEISDQYKNFSELPLRMKRGKKNKAHFVIDYWTSKLSIDSFDIKALGAPNVEGYLQNSLSGIHSNTEITELICHFDYLRNSEVIKEKKIGNFLYEELKKIINLSLDKGKLSHVERNTLTPIIKQGDLEITLDKLSSGNLYFIQRMVSMLGKMYAVSILHDKPVEEICQTEGLLLIDEAENHLHPKWQKTFINNVLSIFPNLQIILTTHSPFIVSSVENVRVYVCESQGDHSIIKDATEDYSNKPIEEVLISEAFGGTQPFNAEISKLLQKRKEATKKKDKITKKSIEAQLLDINPQYFSFLQTDELLAQITHK